jgi:hypothetical protein
MKIIKIIKTVWHKVEIKKKTNKKNSKISGIQLFQAQNSPPSEIVKISDKISKAYNSINLRKKQKVINVYNHAIRYLKGSSNT